MITLFPMRQLWPMCAPAIRKFLSPILVALLSGLPRWIVQYSRMMLSLPISTLVLRSGEYNTSCGDAPMITPCPMKFPLPIATSLSITTCDCTIVLSPITACGPIMENGRSPRRRRFAPPDRQEPSDEFSRCSFVSNSNFGFPLLQNACFLETEVTGVPFRWRANNDVIEQFDLQKLGGFSQTSRQAVVCLAGRRVAGRMIMHYDDSVSRSDQRGPKDVARMSDTFVYASHRDFLHSNQMITRIEQDHA